MAEINLNDALSAIKEQVEPAISKLLTSYIDPIYSDLVHYQIGMGGKRIRPSLLVLSGQLLGGKIEDLIYPAASIEILHNATLISDDIMDGSEIRRNKPTTWKRFGKSIAECLPFTYLIAAFEGLNDSPYSHRLIDLYNKTIKIIMEGQIKDLLFERSGRDDEPYIVENRYKTVTTDDFIQMTGQKTGILLQTSCQAGAICANATEEQIDLIGQFGMNVGIAFQILDDLLDVFGNEQEFGKKIGVDIADKKMGNFVVLTAIEQLGGEDKETVINFLNDPNDTSDEDVAKIIGIISKTNAKDDARKIAQSYIQKALESLDRLPNNQYSEMLIELANYVAERNK